MSGEHRPADELTPESIRARVTSLHDVYHGSRGDAQLRLDWTPDARHHLALFSLGSDDAIDLDLAVENAHDPALSGHLTSVDRFLRTIATWRYEGARPGLPCLMLGSHLDTVRDAGKYDGMLGVLTAIECVSFLNARNKRLPFAIEVIGFGDEEGVRFGTTLAEHGVHERVAQQLLGHADSRTTRKMYTHVSEKMMGEAARRSRTQWQAPSGTEWRVMGPPWVPGPTTLLFLPLPPPPNRAGLRLSPLPR